MQIHTCNMHNAYYKQIVNSKFEHHFVTFLHFRRFGWFKNHSVGLHFCTYAFSYIAERNCVKRNIIIIDIYVLLWITIWIERKKIKRKKQSILEFSIVLGLFVWALSVSEFSFVFVPPQSIYLPNQFEYINNIIYKLLAYTAIYYVPASEIVFYGHSTVYGYFILAHTP